MQETSIHAVELAALFVLLLVTAFAAVARKLQAPYPIVMVAGGLLLSLVPGVPVITLDPELIFLVVLPPLLYSAGWAASWRELSRSLVSVALLAIGLVGFTVFGVAAIGPFLFRGFDWRVALALGAAVATTDAIAATSIAKRLGLPPRIAHLLENESVINDVTGLLALEFAISILVSGQTPTVAGGSLRLAYLILAGIASGLVIALVVEWFERRVDHGPIEIGISILAPYAAYLGAEAIHASGVIAAVTAGLYLGRKSSEFMSPGVRLRAQSVWSSLTFLLNGFVFVLIGLQLPSVLAGVRELSSHRLIFYGILLSLLLILLRLVWTFPSAYVGHFIRTRLLHQDEPKPRARETFLIGWTGMRGVLALAAAMSLPSVLNDGSPFPFRDLIVFLTFSVIVVTLVAQGLTLPPLIRRLGLAGTPNAPEEQRQREEARRAVLQSAINRLEELRHADPPVSSDLYQNLEQHYRRRLSSVGGPPYEEDKAVAEDYFQYLNLSRALLEAERTTALRLRREGAVTDETLRQIEYELDLDETRLRLAIEREPVETAL
jgi:monovalent cation/hydrogen antiporter